MPRAHWRSGGRDVALAVALGPAVLVALLCISTFPVHAQSRGGGGQNILDTAGTMWRYFETWQTDVARLDDGKLVRVDPLNPRTRDKGNAGGPFQLVETQKIIGSEFPPQGWQKPDFDDSNWVRRNGTFQVQYRSLVLMCIRGKFGVVDPGKAADLSLSVAYSGGIVVYVNGQEVGRASLPKGPLTNETLADDYPKECYVTSKGVLINQTFISGFIMGPDQVAKENGDPEAGTRYRQRTRKLDLTVPARLLRRGVNVLAIEAHRAPANPLMFTTVLPPKGPYESELETATRAGRWWNRASIDSVALTGRTDGILPNSSRPRGVQVWSQDAMLNVNWTHYSDPNEELRPIRLRGARGGAFATQVILSSTDEIKSFRASAGELKGAGGAVIPASAVQVRYLEKTWDGWVPDPIGSWVQFDPLQPASPGHVSPINIRTGGKWACQPIWVSVNVPASAKPGDYAGKVVVEADGLPAPVVVPLHLHVSDWTLPDPKDFTLFSDMVQSPDSVALQYKVPLWSEDHWKLIDKSFQMLSLIGAKSIHIPVVRRSHLGNEQGMVRWVRHADGSLKCDFSLVERYLDAAVKRLGKVPYVCFHVLDTGPFHAQGLAYTEMDAKTGALKEAVGPKWGTKESVAFMKPMFDGLRAVMAKRGLEKSMMVGMHAAGGNGPENDNKQAYPDVCAAAGDVRWARVSHYYFGDLERRPGRPKYGCVALVGGVIGVFWDVDTEKPVYGWRNPEILLTYPRTTNGDYAGERLGQDSMLPQYRFCAEAVLTAGRRRAAALTRGNISGEVGYDYYKGLRGFGPFGLDFWPVLQGARGGKTIAGRYGDGYADGGWGTLSFNNVMTSLIAPGKDGPISTARFEMMRESCQEAEARVFVQNALLDEASKTRLGPQLAGRCKELCDDRTRAFRYISEFWTWGGVQNVSPMPEMIFPAVWEDRSQRLYDLAAEVAKALHETKSTPSVATDRDQDAVPQ